MHNNSNEEDLGGKTFFGTKKVDYFVKKGLVEAVFNNVATRYDLMNDIMSGGLHRYWKDQFCIQLDNPSAKLLDVAGGTGDITTRFYNFVKSNGIVPSITMTDINFKMLEIGSNKLTNRNVLGIDYVNADAENLPFSDNSFDYYTVAFGIRNFTDIDKALKEACRVIKPGGKFLCLEFSQPQSAVFNKLYSAYSTYLIPFMGTVFANDRTSYEYLIESIKLFPKCEEFASMIKNSGFKDVAYRTLSQGIVAIHTAYAP